MRNPGTIPVRGEFLSGLNADLYEIEQRKQEAIRVAGSIPSDGSVREAALARLASEQLTPEQISFIRESAEAAGFGNEFNLASNAPEIGTALGPEAFASPEGRAQVRASIANYRRQAANSIRLNEILSEEREDQLAAYDSYQALYEDADLGEDELASKLNLPSVDPVETANVLSERLVKLLSDPGQPIASQAAADAAAVFLSGRQDSLSYLTGITESWGKMTRTERVTSIMESQALVFEDARDLLIDEGELPAEAINWGQAQTNPDLRSLNPRAEEWDKPHFTSIEGVTVEEMVKRFMELTGWVETEEGLRDWSWYAVNNMSDPRSLLAPELLEFLGAYTGGAR